MNHTIKIGEYTVTITGIEHEFLDNLTNTDELLGRFINHMSVLAADAAQYNTENNFPATTDDCDTIAHDCYMFCEGLGMYK